MFIATDRLDSMPDLYLLPMIRPHKNFFVFSVPAKYALLFCAAPFVLIDLAIMWNDLIRFSRSFDWSQFIVSLFILSIIWSIIMIVSTVATTKYLLEIDTHNGMYTCTQWMLGRKTRMQGPMKDLRISSFRQYITITTPVREWSVVLRSGAYGTAATRVLADALAQETGIARTPSS